MEDINYKIRFTDNTVENKNDIIIPPNTINKSTNLLLHGRGSPNFGGDLWQNLVRLLENSCSNDIEPSRPTEGQLWYNANTRELSVYSRVGINDYVWNKILIDGVPNGLLKLEELLEILKGYLKKIGDTMQGPLGLVSDMGLDGKPIITNIDNKNNAVTRTYVDYLINEIDLRYKPLLGLSSKKFIERSLDATIDLRTMENYLVLPTEFEDVNTNTLKKGYEQLEQVSNYAVTKRYVDSKVNGANKSTMPTIVNNSFLHSKNDGTLEWLNDDLYLLKSGGIMSGTLYLTDTDYDINTKTYSSNNKTIAASRQYVDDNIDSKKFKFPSGTIGNFLKLKDSDGNVEWGALTSLITDKDFSDNGYAVIGGLQVCWGNFTPSDRGINYSVQDTINFPKAFNTCFSVIISPTTSTKFNTNFEAESRLESISSSFFIVRTAMVGDYPAGGDSLFPKSYYIAIGI